MATKRSSKMARMIDDLDLCETGKKRAKRKYGKMSLRQAWLAASGSDLRYLFEALRVNPPRPYKCSCGLRSCLYEVGELSGAKARKLFGNKLPEKVRAAYAKA